MPDPTRSSQTPPSDHSHSDHPSLYHFCFTVPDLPAAAEELSELLGVRFGEPLHSEIGEWPYSIAFSETEPHIELISSVAGSPWEAQSPHFHHLGFWSSCLDRTLADWAEAGTEPVFDGREYGRRFAYVDAPRSGVRLEAVDLSQQADFLSRWTR